jgi:hypothetical protein
MKCFHLRWVTATLTDLEKANRVRHTQEMIQALDNHSGSGFKYLLAGDESWMTCELCYDIVDQLQAAIMSMIEGIPKTKLIQFFQTWRRRLEKYVQQEGDYFESTEFDPANNICFYSREVG